MNDNCNIIGNNFANMIQIVVFILSLSCLFLHKIFIENNAYNIYLNAKLFLYNKICYRCINNIDYNELNTRKWSVWFMDNIKQGLSTLAGHFWAIYASKLLSNDISDDISDECGWYLIQFLVDTLIAILLSFLFSKLLIILIGLISKSFVDKWLSIGNYNENSGYNNKMKYYIWIFQTFHWLVCNISARILVTYFIISIYPYFLKINIWFSNFWINNRKDELIVVTLIVPLIMNSFQLLIQNWFLRWKVKKSTKMKDYTQKFLSDI